MAKWDGTLDFVMTTEQAAAYARMSLTEGNAIDQTLNSHHLLRFLFGARTVQGKKLFTGKNGEQLAVSKMGFGNARPADAFRIEFDVMVAVSTGSALTVSNSTSAQSTKTVDSVRKFEFANFIYEDTLTVSKLLSLFQNKRVIRPSAINENIMAMHEGWASTVESQAMSTAGTAAVGPTETNFGALDFLLSDGLTAAARATYWTALGYADSATGTPDETNYKQYMVDRSATGNEWARAILRRPGTTVTTAQLRTYKRQVKDNGAVNPVAWLNPTNFDQITNEVGNPANSGIRNQYMADKIQEFGLKDYIIVDNDLLVTYDKSIPSNRGYILDADVLAPCFSVLDAETFSATHLRYADMVQYVCGQQNLIKSPRRCVKMLIQ